MRAEPAHQSLSEDTFERRRDEKRLNTHVQQPGYRARRVVGVQRAKDLVTSQSRANRNLSSFRIPNFAHHHHVGVLAQNGTQSVGEVKIAAWPNGNLRHAWQFIFNRVLDGQNLFLGGINPLEDRIEGGCFAAAGWSSSQE